MKMHQVLVYLAWFGLSAAYHDKQRKYSGDAEDYYRSHVFSHYLSKEGKPSDASDGVYKRDVKLSSNGFWHHDGPYVSHNQAERKAQQYDSYVTPLPEEYDTDPVPDLAHFHFGKSQPQTSASPYTYAVNAMSVTPSPYHTATTPVPYNQVSYSPQPQYYSPSEPFYVHPSPKPRHGPTTPSPYYGPSSPTQYSGPSTPAPFYGPSSPPPYSGPSTPAPYYGPSSPAPHYGAYKGHTAPSPFYGPSSPYSGPSTPAPNFGPTRPPLFFGLPSAPHTHHSAPSFHHGPTYPHYPDPAFSHDTSIQLAGTHELPHHDQYASQKHHDQHHQKTPAISFVDSPRYPNPSFPIQSQSHGNSLQHQELPPSPEQPAAVPHQASPLSPNLVPDQLTNLALTFQRERKEPANQEQLSPPHQQHSLGLQLFSKQSRQHKSIPFKPSLAEFHSNDIHQQTPLQRIPAHKQTLFESITQEADERPIHKKQTQPKKQKMPKSAALERLMAIAGDNWDLERGIESNLLDTNHTTFSCPYDEGHYPDPASCSVYYQCAAGTPHKHHCDAGLGWNTETNQCDWKHNVDCSKNSRYYKYY